MKKIKSLAIVLMVMITLTGCGSKSKKLTKDGYELLENGEYEIGIELLEEAAQVDKNKDTLRILSMGREYVTLKEGLTPENDMNLDYYVDKQKEFEKFKKDYKEYIKGLDIDKQWSNEFDKEVDIQFSYVLEDLEYEILNLKPNDIENNKELWKSILSSEQMKELDNIKNKINKLKYSHVIEEKLPSLESYDISMNLVDYFDILNPSEGEYPSIIFDEDEYKDYFMELYETYYSDYRVLMVSFYSSDGLEYAIEMLNIFKEIKPKFTNKMDDHILFVTDYIELTNLLRNINLADSDINIRTQAKTMIDAILLKHENFRNLGFIQELTIYIYGSVPELL